MKLLVANVGSTSLKFKLYEMPGEEVLCAGRIERIGDEGGADLKYRDLRTQETTRLSGLRMPTYQAAVTAAMDLMTAPGSGVVGPAEEIGAVGFKTVLAKGFYGVHELTGQVLQGMRDYLSFAPAHNGPYLETIGLFRQILPSAALVGVFETAFHCTIPKYRRLYAIPYEWYEEYGIMKMGYHGASHSYVAEESAKYGKNARLISCHLGGSSSVCAIKDGESVDTSFGFSLQTGVPHSARAGDTDAYIIPFLLGEGLTMDEILAGLGRRGGLLGLSGISGDLRDLETAAGQGNERARLALDVYSCSIVRFIGMFYAELGGLDQLVFTGGIGEHSRTVRREVCRAVAHFGIELDEGRNEGREGGIISTDSSPVTVTVIPADEELGIARRTHRYLLARSRQAHRMDR